MKPDFFHKIIVPVFLLKKRNIKSTLKLKNILDPEGEIFSLNKKTNLF